MWVISVANTAGTFRFKRNLYAGSVRIGRAADNEIQLPGARVSRHHGRIDVEDGRLVYRDLNSRNGSFIETRRIEQPMPLTIGSVIDVGGYLVTIEPDPELRGLGHITERAAPEPVTAPIEPIDEQLSWPSPIDLLKTVRAGMRDRRAAEQIAARQRQERMDREWAQLLVAARQLRDHIGHDPRVVSFVFSDDGREISVKLKDALRNGGHLYLILSRGHPDQPDADADEAVWIREIGGEDRRFTEPRHALEALVRHIAVHVGASFS